MSFPSMIKELKRQGLLDDKGNLTQKGHEYVGEVKKKYDTKLSKSRQRAEKNSDDRSEVEDEPERVC